MNDRRPSPLSLAPCTYLASHTTAPPGTFGPRTHSTSGRDTTLGMSFLTLQGTGCMQFKNPVLGQDKWLNAQASWYTRGLWASPRWPQAGTATSLASWTLSTSPGQERPFPLTEPGRGQVGPDSSPCSTPAPGPGVPTCPPNPCLALRPCSGGWGAVLRADASYSRETGGGGSRGPSGFSPGLGHPAPGLSLVSAQGRARACWRGLGRGRAEQRVQKK